MGFTYIRPDTIEAAVALAASGGTVLAGGQSLMPLVKRGAVRVASLVDINRLPGLAGVEIEDGWLRIGALARLEALRTDPLVRAVAPLLAATLPAVANPAVRMRGTLVGNLVTNAPGAEAVAVAALAEARLVCRTESGAITVPLGGVPPDGVVVEARLRVSPAGTRAGFHELQKRFGHLGTVGCGVEIPPDGSIRSVFSGLIDAPMFAPTLDARLTAGARDPAELSEAIHSDLAGRTVRSDLHADADYRRAVAPIVALRALAAAENGGRRA